MIIEYGILLLQALVGLGLFFGHGLGKLKDIPGTMRSFKQMGYGRIGGLYASLVEGIGALLLVLAVYPKVMAALIAVNMLGAMSFHWKNRDDFKGGWETPFLYFAAAVGIVLAGYSPWGLMLG